MRRWNGWGDEAVNIPLEISALDYLEKCLDPGLKLEDASLEQVLVHVPESRLPENSAVFTDSEVRVRHARGQSLPDWIAINSGKIGVFPDGVWYPTSASEVRTAIEFASQNQISIIPYGGGTSVVGHIDPIDFASPILTLDLSHMNLLLDLDPSSRLATLQSGASGPAVERQLREHGFTLGHFPQSYEYSTLGGWIATRSSGQQSLYYGRIEDTFAGGRLETPSGSIESGYTPGERCRT